MAVTNGYCTLSDFKLYLTAPQQELSIDGSDDNVMRSLIERASRRVDDLMGMGRVFYPYVQTKYYDTPEEAELWLDDDLLAVITLTNGDASTIASTEYHLIPYNRTPYYALTLTDVTTTRWEDTSTASSMRAISLNGIWGYREEYSVRGWITGSTLNEASNLNASDLTFTVTSGSSFKEGQIIKIENEILNVSSVSSNDITVIKRGDNGSTAATHANTTAVSIWQVHEEIAELTVEVARLMYRARFGGDVETNAITTPAGVIVTPRSLPAWAQEVIRKYKRVA